MNKCLLSIIMAACITTSANAVDLSATAQSIALGPIPHLVGAALAFRVGLSILSGNNVEFTVASLSKGLGDSITQAISHPLSKQSLIGVLIVYCAARLTYMGVKETKEEIKKLVK